MINLLKENKKAIFFLAIFIGVYLVLNTLYGFYIQYYSPGSDPYTQLVTAQVTWFLSLFDHSINYYPTAITEYIPIANDQRSMIYVFEGCNGINVMIVYFSFLVAFRGTTKHLLKFSLLGIVSIHIVNLLRIGLLYGVALHFPEQLYFVHKYFFTGIIYVMVFVLWYFWIKTVRVNEPAQA